MALGTAGFTAALSVSQLLHHGVTPSSGPVLVTGATGGVGSIAVALLAKLGFHVVAATGKTSAKEFLHLMGASETITRDEAIDTSGKPLLGGTWAGVVDTVGGPMLATAIRRTRMEGAVTCCGNIGSAELNVSIYPFILRGVALFGTCSAFTPMPQRMMIWKKLATDWKIDALEMLVHRSSLEEVDRSVIDLILRGSIQGRVVIDMATG
jgi:putative YhdH/YhfP family quinone oxidoreductase